MKIKYAFLLLAFFATKEILNAQKKDTAKTSVVICGTTDSASSVEIVLYPKSIVSSFKFSVPYHSEVVDHNFKIKIPPITEPTYITVMFRYPYRWLNGLELFLIEPGDSITISQTSSSFYFPGKNSEKFSCQYQMQQVKPTTQLGSWSRSKDIYRDLERFEFTQDSICTVRLKILSDARSCFGSKAYDLTRWDCIYAPQVSFYSNADFILRGKDSTAKKVVIQYYLDKYTRRKIDTANTSAQRSSYKFIELILQKTTVDCELMLNGYKPSLVGYAFRSAIDRIVFEKIDTSYSLSLKQYLLTAFFGRPSARIDSLTDLISRAIKEIREPYFRNILTDLQRRSPGVPAYDFALPDSNGKKVSLSNYKGKVVVVDFWYSGCVWCVEMAKTLKIVAAEKDTNVVYITICADNSKTTWKTSLKKGIFTSNDEINLYTDGLGFNHPLINYYRIAAYPILFIIDKAGKLFSVNPELGLGVETKAQNLKRISLELAKRSL